ncbi:unnamed protein product, partial [Scytosiphon promiscuus]
YALLPRTLSALRQLPLAPETAAFQRQLPGTGLPLHVDPSNFVLGCHLGVVIPPPIGDPSDRRNGKSEKAWIEVAGEKRHWETGGAFVFDPSFLHRTRNPTEGERVILNIDIWHPGLSEVEKTAIRRVCELVEQWNARSGVFEK